MPPDVQLLQTRVAASRTLPLDDGGLFVEFPRAVFGTLVVPVTPSPASRTLVAHLGEALDADGRIDRRPPGTIRYRRIEQAVEPGRRECRLRIPPDARNTGPAAIRMPAAVGEVLPFRYAEIEDAAGLGLLEPSARAAIRQVFVHAPFDDDAAAFRSSSAVLDAVWALCKHTIKATTFCGLYVDGDRERIPYEGDAYINQLCHYGVDCSYDMARRSHEYMLRKPTWPTEWHLQSVLMAWTDYLYTGDPSSLRTCYDDLCAKTLADFAREDGLVSVAPGLRTPAMSARLAEHAARGVLREDIRDLVDWPPGSFALDGAGERDGHDMRPVNTVVNAFHCHALRLMSRIAGVLERPADSRRFAEQSDRVCRAINQRLYDDQRGTYIDGEGSGHASLHSNLFPLAFDLVPASRRERVLAFVRSRGMACSVYGAQHLLDALYRHGADRHALELMTAQHDRSWWNMIRAGSTMTLEAWDLRYKKNLDWNHAWGAAPANIIPRRLLGVRPLTPGFASALIRPQPGTLAQAAGRVPTARGPVEVAFEQEAGRWFALQLEIPPGMTARVAVPQPDPGDRTLRLDGRRVEGDAAEGALHLQELGPGRHEILAGPGAARHGGPR